MFRVQRIDVDVIVTSELGATATSSKNGSRQHNSKERSGFHNKSLHEAIEARNDGSIARMRSA